MFASLCTLPCTKWNRLWKDSLMLKQIHTHLYLPEGPHWHGDIKKHWHSSGVFIVNFDKIQHLFLVFYCWILGGGGRHCQLHLPVSKPIYIKFKSIQSVGFEETSTNFIGTYSKNIGRIVNIEKKCPIWYICNNFKLI